MKPTLLFLALVTALCVTGCAPVHEQRQSVLSQASVVERDGCQYLFYSLNGKFAFTHKGDCKNPIHRVKAP